MKLIKQSVQYLEEVQNLEDMFKMIELSGRVCYKSEDKITESSSEFFTKRLVNSRHLSVLEHGTVYLKIPINDHNTSKYADNPYSSCFSDTENCYKGNGFSYITTNYRVLVENGWLEDLEYICEPTQYHARIVSFKFITNRAIANEFVRHRVFSFSQESSRYCNYSKDKFSKEITFIEPDWLKSVDSTVYGNFLSTLSNIENLYMSSIKAGLKAQEIRDILPLCTKTELVMTGFICDWKHFLELRLAKSAHPQAQKLAQKVENILKDMNLL